MLPPAALVSLLVLAVLWGSAFPLIKVGLEGLGVLHLTLARHLVASACFVPFLLLMRRRLRPEARDVPFFFLLGLLGITVYHVALNVGELRVSAGATSLIIASSPALTAVIAYFLADDRLPPLGWLGSGIAFAGVALVALGDAGGGGGRSAGVELEPWALLPLLSAVVTSFYFVLQRRVLDRYRPVEVAAFSTWAGTVPLLLFLPGFGADVADAGWRALAATLYIGAFPSAVAYTLFSIANRIAPVTVVTAFLYSVPVFSLAFSFLLLGEVPAPLTVLGGAVAIAGIALVNRAKRRGVRSAVRG